MDSEALPVPTRGVALQAAQAGFRLLASNPVSVLASLTASWLLFLALRRLAALRTMPLNTKPLPGPKGRPIVGNLFDIPPQHSWIKFKEWADEYGPIYQLSLGGRQHVVVSTEKVANDLLRERGNYYSSREQTTMAAELLSHNLRPLFLPYNDLWRRGRKFMHQVTMQAAAASYESAQMLESARAVCNLVRDPSSYQQAFEMYSAGLVFRIGYGKRLVTGREEALQRIVRVVHNLERIASPGAYLVDTVPALKHLPAWLAPFKREAARLHAEELSLFCSLLEEARQRARDEKGKNLGMPTSFAAQFDEQQERLGLSDDEGAYVIGTLFEAGSGTTAAAMMSFCLAMTLHPEWQELAWEELDRVCGESRLPVFDDVPQLPAVRALVKEVLRWRPVTAGGVPHQATRDDAYEGFAIPAGAVVHANQWAIHREPALYPDPETFNPRRWLEPGYPTFREPLSRFPNLQNYSSFGFGRRICPGMNIAERSLYILVARVLWVGRFSRRRDPVSGRELDVPEYDYVNGFNTQPKPFPFAFEARSEERRTVLEQAWETAQREDPLK